MIQAGRAKLDELLGFGMLGPLEMAAKFATYPEQEKIVAAVLAAALGVCEVREEPGMRQVNSERPESGGDLWADDCPSGRYFQEAVKSWADMAAAGDAGPWSHSASSSPASHHSR